ncbi:DUF6572 domain-containing protein [Actinopolymorpha sp. B9G3]|uniref:DUF6572 domain-containing protein n=1 Tax=Actinopolymorpha sp. B9G3 TaxID=3158970 RepID=UPI0032D994F4
MRFGRKHSEALFDPGKVDLVAETADGVVELVIVADAPWTGSDAQLSSLQDKVQTYVSFALDGQMERSFPEAAGRPWRIVVSAQAGDPDHRTNSVLQTLADRLPQYGGSLLIRHL